MIIDVLKNIARFLILSLLQVLVISHVPLGSHFVLLPYVLFILMLPFETPKIIVLFASFVLGLTMDAFYDTGGMHAAACVLMGFSRTHILKLISPREGYDNVMKPTVQYMGKTWFSTYALILIFIHHFVFFYLEVFGFSEFFSTLLRALGSTLATFVFIYIVQFLFYRNDKISI